MNNIQPYVSIGNNVILWSGNHIGHHSKIEDHVFITSHCVISGNCLIKSYSWLGVNSTLRNNITLEQGSLIAMSASIIKDTEKYTVYMADLAVFLIRSLNFRKARRNGRTLVQWRGT